MENITVNTEFGYQELKANEGFLITDFKEGDDIMTYYASEEVCAPIGMDISKYHSITLAEHEVKMNEKEIAMAEFDEKEERLRGERMTKEMQIDREAEIDKEIMREMEADKNMKL